MSDAFIGEIRAFGFTFAPVNWAFCDGQLMSIAQNSALFAIIGTFYGGDGQTTFALPNLQGRTGIQQGTGPGLSTYFLGEQSGTETITLTQGQMPLHSHEIDTKAPATQTQAARIPSSTAFLASSNPDKLYSNAAPSPTTSFAMNAIGITGQSLPHDNQQPYLVVNFCMCQFGIFPSRN